jgi:hypothetical protein
MPRAVNTFDQRMLEKADSYSSITAAQFSPNLGLNNFIPSGDTFPTQPNNIVSDGLVLYLDAAINNSYPQSGTTWYDLSVYRNNVTLVNDPTYNSFGYFSLNGTNYMVGSAPSAMNNTNVTINAWARTNNINNFGGNFLVNFGGNPSYWLAITIEFAQYPGKACFYTSTNWTRSDLTLSNNVWYNIVATFSPNVNKIYINGTLNKTDTAVDSSVNYIPPLDNLYIGRRDTLYYMNGDVSIISIYNRTLDSSEILQNYNATKSRFGL